MKRATPCMLLAAALMPCHAPALSAATASGAVAPPTVRIEMRPQVSLRDAAVTLGDIAWLSSTDLPALRRLMALPIGTAPRAGDTAQLDRDTLVRWTEARAGGVALDWSGAWDTRLERAVQVLDAGRLAAAARQALLDGLGAQGFQAEAQLGATVPDLVLPQGALSLRVRPIAGLSRPDRRMQVWVDAWVDQRFVRSAALSFEVRAMAPVPVAARRIEAGEAAQAGPGGAIAIEPRDVARDSARARVAAPQALAEPQRLRRAADTGEPLARTQLAAAPAVSRGQQAMLDVRSGDIRVQSRVEVLQDGRVGELVRVKTPAGTAPVLARVTGLGAVEAQP